MKSEREVKNGGVEEEIREMKRKRVIEEEDEDRNSQELEDDASKGRGKHSRHVEARRDCPYLDTVNRQVLDFDFERFCSVSLSNINVYACLVCGKYFQGRSHKSHAYTHSLEAGHHVYINLLTEKLYCLPDGYEMNDPSLDDIRHVLTQGLGETVTEVVRPRLARMRYRVTKTPPYLMFHMVRFKKNSFFKEKKPTLVKFPLKDMELRDYIPSLPTSQEGEKKFCSKYNLIANIVHDGKPEDGYFRRVFVQRKSQELWYEMQDLHVAETLPQMVELSEAYVQIYEQQETN